MESWLKIGRSGCVRGWLTLQICQSVYVNGQTNGFERLDVPIGNSTPPKYSKRCLHPFDRIFSEVPPQPFPILRTVARVASAPSKCHGKGHPWPQILDLWDYPSHRQVNISLRALCKWLAPGHPQLGNRSGMGTDHLTRDDRKWGSARAN